MATQIPSWFSYEVYMTNKLAQMKATDATYTMDQLFSDFAKAGFAGAEGAYNHFVQFGADEEVAPNAYFNAKEYYIAKAVEYCNSNGEKVTAATISEFQINTVKQLIDQAGMNAWTHYEKFGSSEGVNPSNAFDAAAYCAAKAAVMGGDWTADSVMKAITNAKMSVLDHFLQYAGTGTDEITAEQQAAGFPVADADKVPTDTTNPGKTFTLTQGVDTPVGTDGNDTFVAADHNKVTTSANEIFGLGDEIKGGAGTDTLTVLGDGALGSIQLAKFASVEKANLTSDSATGVNQNVDLTSLVAGGLTDVTVDAGNTITLQNLAKAVNVGVKGAALANDAGVTFQFDDATTTADAINLSLNAATMGAAGQRVINTLAKDGVAGIETVNLTAEGVSNVQLNSGNTMTTLNVAATGKTTIDANSTVLATVNAAASTASVIVDATSVATATNKLAFTGGTGDDKLTVNNASFLQASATTSASSFDGGNGTDEFVLQDGFDNSGNAGANTQRDSVNKLVGFEQFTVDGAATIDASRVTSVSKFGLQDTDGDTDKNAVFTNLSNSNSIVVQSDYNQVNLSMTTGQTVANLEVESTAAGTDVAGGTVNGVQTLNIVSTQSAATHAVTNTIGALTVNNATNFLVNVSGAQDIRLGNGTAGNDEQFVNQRSTIDASTLTGKLNVNGSIDNDIIKGGSAADTIRGNGGADTLTGNGGNDTFVFGFGNAAGAGFVPADASVTEIKVTAANNVSSITIGIDRNGDGDSSDNGETVTVTTGLSDAANTTQLAAALQTGLRTALGDDKVSVTVKDATTVTVTDAAGRMIDETNFAVLQDDAIAEVAPATDTSAVAVVTNGNRVTPSESTITFATSSDVLALTSFDLDNDAASSVFTAGQVTISTGSNINTIAKTLQAAAASGVTITAISETKLSIVDSNGNGLDENSLTSTGANAFAQEVTKGTAVTASTVALTPTDITDVSAVTITLDDVTKTVSLADTAWANDAAFATALQTALQTAFDTDVTVTNSQNASDNEVTISDALGRTFGATVTVTDEGTKAIAATTDSNATATEVTAGQEATPGTNGANSESNINTLDTITDFVKGADKIDLLAFDNTAVAAPTKAWYAGDVTATAGANNLAQAIALAVSDVNGATQTGSVVLGANEAVLFQYSGNTYVLVNDATAAYSATDDVLVKISGSLSLTEGALTVADFFA